MIQVSDTPELLNARLPWDAAPTASATEDAQRSIVERRICDALEVASHERLLRPSRPGRPIRYRLGHAIAGLGERIAGPTSTTRPT